MLTSVIGMRRSAATISLTLSLFSILCTCWANGSILSGWGLVLQVAESFGFLCNPDCFLLRACYPCQVFAMWGLRHMTKIWEYDIMTMGLVYPLSEHVDIFPVRLVPTFH